MMLQGVIPIVLVGMALPIGLVACFLIVHEKPIMGAIDHGELFLVAANAAFGGCFVLVFSRPDQLVNAIIATFVTIIGIVVPCYALWAGLTVQVLMERPLTSDWIVIGGSGYAVIAMLVALSFVWLSYRPTSTPI